jgi:hypothetical protein
LATPFSIVKAFAMGFFIALYDDKFTMLHRTTARRVGWLEICLMPRRIMPQRNKISHLDLVIFSERRSIGTVRVFIAGQTRGRSNLNVQAEG